MLTTVTTVIGLFPTAYGIGGNEEFLQPMVLALAWGLVFGSILTLCLFPVNFYSYILFRSRLLPAGNFRPMETHARASGYPVTTG